MNPNSLHSKLLINKNLNKKNPFHKRILIRKLLHNVTYSQVMYFAKHGFFVSLPKLQNYHYYYFLRIQDVGILSLGCLQIGNYILPVKTWSQIFATFAMLILFQFCNLFWIGRRIGHFCLVGCLPHSKVAH